MSTVPSGVPPKSKPSSLAAGRRKSEPIRRDEPDRLPPHSLEAEEGILGCALLAFKPSMEACRKSLTGSGLEFYDLRNRVIYEAMLAAYNARKLCDMITLSEALKSAGKLEEVGGLGRLMALPNAVPSAANLDYYLEIVREKFALRQAIQAARRLVSNIYERESIEDIKADIGETVETLKQAGQEGRESPFPRIYTVNEIMAYKSDPDQWLVGDEILKRREFAVLAGVPSAGKSMLATALAIAGARGDGHWMGLQIHRPIRTLILQSEGSETRYQTELQGLPDKLCERIRISEMGPFRFWDAAYRSWLRDVADTWPYDLLILDNFSDVVPDDKRADHQMAFDWIRQSIPSGQAMPCVLLIAHLTKAVLKADRPMTGRTMMAHVTGSMRIMEKARTQMTLQPASSDINDNRVVFDFAKASNAKEVPARACYRRQPQVFELVPDFDFDAWLNPERGDGGARISEDDFMEILDFGNRRLARSHLVKELCDDRRWKKPTAYEWIARLTKAGKLSEAEGLLKWEGEA